jgi:aarF domain-containing kinase
MSSQLRGHEEMPSAPIKRLCFGVYALSIYHRNEIEKQFLSEFDYRKEAENLSLIRSNVLPHWGHKVGIPEPILDLCTYAETPIEFILCSFHSNNGLHSTDVLVMDRLKGKKLIDGIRDKYRALAAHVGKSFEELEADQLDKIKRGVIKPQTLWESKVRVHVANWIVSILDAVHNSCAFTINQTIARLGIVHRRAYRHTPTQINLSSILEVLLAVHAHQVRLSVIFDIALLFDGQ